MFTVPSTSEVDRGKVARGMAACRHDSKRQHGHLLPQVSLAIFTQSVDEQAYLFLASQSGALRISAYRDFQPNPNPLIAFGNLSLSLVIRNNACKLRQINEV